MYCTYDNITTVKNKAQQFSNKYSNNLLTNACSGGNIDLIKHEQAFCKDSYKYITQEDFIMNTARRNIKRARIVQLRKRLFLSGTVIAVLWVMVFTITGLKDVNATNNSDNPMYKYYTSYEIQPGDTLTSIAQRYTVNSNVSISEYIREVKKNNNLVSDRITSGNYIVISYYSDEYK